MMKQFRPLVKVKWLGLISYQNGLDVQRSCLMDSLKSPNSNSLLLLQHKPVYTVGIRTKNYPESEAARLKIFGAEFFKTDRGGLITFHGPGQLVGYPILNLKQFHPAGSVKWYVCRLEKMLVDTCQRFGLENVNAPGHPLTGVFVGPKKIASIGIHAKRYVTSHGVALNCDVDLSWFDHIVPCGLEDVRVTSLSEETTRKIATVDVVEPFLSAFQRQFQCDFEFDESVLNTFKNVHRNFVSAA